MMISNPISVPDGSKKMNWMLLMLSLISVNLFFFPVYSTPYAYIDDYWMLASNIRYLYPTFENWMRHFTDPDFDIFAPLTYSVWHVISFFSVSPNAFNEAHRLPSVPFKVVSLLSHCFSTWAAGWMLTQLQMNRTAVIFGMLFFGLHPIQVESVAWTTGLKDELCGLFSFLSIGYYLKYLNGGKRATWTKALIFVTAAAMSKPTSVILPATLFVIDFFWTDRKNEDRIRDVIYFLVPVAITSMVMLQIQARSDIPSPLWSRPLILFDSLSFYLYKIVFPFNLVPDYGRSPDFVLRHHYIFWTWVLSLVIIILAIKYGRRHLKIATVLFMFPILPVSGLITFDMQEYTTVTDHYLYQSILGIGLAVASLMKNSKICKLIASIVLVSLGCLSYRQSLEWKNPKLLLEKNAALYRESVFSRSTLAKEGMNTGDPEYAHRYAMEAIEISQHAVDYSVLAESLLAMNRGDEAFEMAQRAVEARLADRISIRRLIKISKNMNRLDIAEIMARRWITLDPHDQMAIEAMNQIKNIRSSAATQPATNRIMQ